MSPSPYRIRRAVPEDQEIIANLLGQLGYDISSLQISERLTEFQSSSSDAVFVATTDEAIVGCISLHRLPLFHSVGFLGRITSLVIDKQYRRQRVGSSLIGAATDWFLTSGCVKVEVTSGDHRSDAHHFYETQGFSRDGQRLSKKFAGEP